MEKKETNSISGFFPPNGIIEYVMDKNLTLMELQKIKEHLWQEINLEIKEDHFASLFRNLDFVASILSKEEYTKFLQSARIYFYMELMQNPFLETPYFELFKIEIIDGFYKESYGSLDKCQEKATIPLSNFNLLYKLLDLIVGKDVARPSGNQNYIQSTKVTYMPLLRNYQLAEKEFLKKNYKKMVKHLEVCAKLASLKNIAIDFQPTLILAKKVAEMQLNAIKSSMKLELEMKNSRKNGLSLRDDGIMSLTSLGSNEAGARIVLAYKLLNLDKTDIDSYFFLMDAYIDLKAYTPIPELLEEISQLEPTKEQKSIIENYEKLIYEKTIEANYARDISSLLASIESLQAEGKYEEVISKSIQGYKKFSLPYFKAKVAVACYHLGFFKEAEEYALAYLQEGYIATMEVSTLLYKIYMRNNDLQKAISISLECYQKCRLKSRGIPLDEWTLVQQREYLSDKLSLEQSNTKSDNCSQKFKRVESSGSC